METVKPLAKSLHTVSVLVNLARYLLQGDPKVHSEFTAIEQACVILELEGKPDVYDLKGQALKQLSKR